MDDTRAHICFLIRLVAAHSRRSFSTVSRKTTGSGDTLRRLEAVNSDGKPRHRITTDRVHQILYELSSRFPADLEWPRNIPRPPKSKKEAA